MTNLTGKRVLILGAETEIGRAVTSAVAEAGASVAAVAATSDAEAAFAVQRLARRLSSGERKAIAQAIDATNEAAVRVMVRQVSKELGGLDAVVSLIEPGEPAQMSDRKSAMGHIKKFGWKELESSGGGALLMVMREGRVHTTPADDGGKRATVLSTGDSLTITVTGSKVNFLPLIVGKKADGEVASMVVDALASGGSSG